MKNHIFYELFRGLAYRRIQHRNMRYYTTYIPAFLSIISLGIYFLSPIKPKIIGEKSIFEAMQTFISMLPGFYFAGLAAVATFGHKGMDYEMPSPAPEIHVMVNGENTSVKLTKRQFLSYLFSYLVILSLFLSFFLMISNVSYNSISTIHIILEKHSCSILIWLFFKIMTIIFVLFIFFSMITTTLHGIFFLTEKIHQA